MIQFTWKEGEEGLKIYFNDSYFCYNGKIDLELIEEFFYPRTRGVTSANLWPPGARCTFAVIYSLISSDKRHKYDPTTCIYTLFAASRRQMISVAYKTTGIRNMRAFWLIGRRVPVVFIVASSIRRRLALASDVYFHRAWITADKFTKEILSRACCSREILSCSGWAPL